MVEVVFQSAFRLEMHQNNIFFIFLQHIKTIQNHQKKKKSKAQLGLIETIFLK